MWPWRSRRSYDLWIKKKNEIKSYALKKFPTNTKTQIDPSSAGKQALINVALQWYIMTAYLENGFRNGNYCNLEDGVPEVCLKSIACAIWQHARLRFLLLDSYTLEQHGAKNKQK